MSTESKSSNRNRKAGNPPPESARGRLLDPVVKALLEVIARIPEPKVGRSDDPAGDARRLSRRAGQDAGILAGALALPPGWVGMLTILPDLMGVWRVQAQLVSDIAALHGKSAQLDQQAMLYCLFRHVAAKESRDLLARLLDRSLSNPQAMQLLQQVGTLLGRRLTQRALRKGAARWLPVAGAIGVGVYAMDDTRQVASTATELFGTAQPGSATRRRKVNAQ